jgi:flagellar motor switch protein FliN/FliY
MDPEKLRITKTILPELFDLDTTPLLPKPIQFSWDDLANQLVDKLRLRSLQLESEVPSYSNKTQFEYPHFTIAFHIGTFADPIFILVGQEEVENCARHLLGIQNKEPFEAGYLEGFKDFLVGMVIHTVEKQFQTDGWTLKASDTKEIEGAPFLEYGVKALIDAQVPLDLIVAIPKNFLEEWRSYFRQKGYQSFYRQTVQSLIELTTVLEIGWVKLQKSDYEALEPGDFICTDQLMWLPGKKRGRAFLSHKGHPLFLVAVKAEGFKVLEQANHYEVGTIMEKEEEFFDEESDIEEGDEEGSEEEGLVEEENTTPVEEHVTDVAPEAQEQQLPVQQESAQPFSLTNGEVVIKIEVGRLKITLDKLLQMEPGNILKLNTTIENGVNLIVHDKMIGRGELVSIGDLIGVRILNLGA